MTRFASVFPLVNARALAREFTYSVPDEVGPGAIVEVPFGNARRRGVVTAVDVPPPDGIEAVAVGSVVGEVPPALIERNHRDGVFGVVGRLSYRGGRPSSSLLGLAHPGAAWLEWLEPNGARSLGL